MTFKRKKSTLYLFPLLAVAFTSIYLVFQFEKESFKLFQGISYLIISIWYTVYSIYLFRTPQVDITDEAIHHYAMPKKSILIQDIKEMTYTAGDFIIKSNTGKKIRIIKSELRAEEITTFEETFENLKESVESSNLKTTA